MGGVGAESLESRSPFTVQRGRVLRPLRPYTPRTPTRRHADTPTRGNLGLVIVPESVPVQSFGQQN
jgi:hypothetical protein